MDFIFSTNSQDIEAMQAALMSCGYSATDFVHQNAQRRWGAVVATRSPYRGYNPLVRAKKTYIVVGDPLLVGARGSTQSTADAEERESARTAALAALWKRAAPLPYHPSALIRINYSRRSVEVVTDAWSAVPLFYRVHPTRTLIATSPDLIASVAPSRVDRISAKEFLAAGQISFPHTLYTDIKQVPPGAVTVFGKRGVATTAWWRPPLPDASLGLDDWREAIRSSVIETMRRIATEVGGQGTATLSAGLDSRYLVSVAHKEELLTPTALTLTVAPNYESWVASRVAKRLQMPFEHRLRQPDHYANVMLSKPIHLSTQVDWRHAHFHRQALGTLPHDAYLLGGFMADTLFVQGDPFYGARSRALRAGVLEPESPRWALTELIHQFKREDVAAIDERWCASDEVLGLTDQHSASLRNIFPSIRQGHKAHFEAARRNYPIYEPFMTATALELGFKMPSSMKAGDAKDHFFGVDVAELDDLPVNPSKDRKVANAMAAFKEVFPKELWPHCVRYPGAWDERGGRRARVLRRELSSAREAVSELLELELPGRRDISRLSVQIRCTLERAGSD